MALMTFVALYPRVAALPCPPPMCRNRPVRKILAPDAKLELLFTRSLPIKGGLTEGPTVATDGRHLFLDIPFGSDKGKIIGSTPNKTDDRLCRGQLKSNGLKFGRQRSIYACEALMKGPRRFRWDLQNKKPAPSSADKYMGKRFNAPTIW